MKDRIRFVVALAVTMSVAGAVGFAQSAGEATYKAKCQTCHGATGMADSAMGKATKTRPVTDLNVKKLTAAEMIAFTTNGKEMMKPFKDKLTDAEIKDAVSYFRTLIK